MVLMLVWCGVWLDAWWFCWKLLVYILLYDGVLVYQVHGGTSTTTVPGTKRWMVASQPGEHWSSLTCWGEKLLASRVDFDETKHEDLSLFDGRI